MAILAGAALAIANARVDVEDDTRAGVASVATALGPDRAWWINAALMAAATGLGIAFVGRGSWAPVTIAAIAIGTGLVSLGVAVGRGPSVVARRRGWEAQAIGAAVAAVGWISGMLPGT
jgi:4-hydroxybenzoate polyprenyltransferase